MRRKGKEQGLQDGVGEPRLRPQLLQTGYGKGSERGRSDRASALLRQLYRHWEVHSLEGGTVDWMKDGAMANHVG